MASISELSKAYSRTSCAKLTLNVSDTEASGDATAYSADAAAFSDFSLLTSGSDYDSPPAIGFFDSGLPLAGEYFPEDPNVYDWGFFSLNISDENGLYDETVCLRFDFENLHSSPGISLVFFADGVASSVRAAFYNGSTLINENSMTDNNSSEIFIVCPAEQFDAVTLEFSASARPYSPVRVAKCVFGFSACFTDDDILSLEISSEQPKDGSELVPSVLSAVVFDPNGVFDMMNSSGFFGFLQDRQKISAYLGLSGRYLRMGVYYLYDWESDSARHIRFHAKDTVGVLGDIPYRRVKLYSQSTALEVFTDILSESGLDFCVDTSFAALAAKGISYSDNLKDALADACIAFGARAYSDRSGVIRVVPFTFDSEGSAFEIDRQSIIGTAKFSRSQYYSDVSCDYVTITFGETETVFSDAVSVNAPGTYFIALSGLYSNVSVECPQAQNTQCFCGGVFLEFAQSGEYRVSVSGKRISSLYGGAFRLSGSVSVGEMGSGAKITSNSFITDPDSASLCAGRLLSALERRGSCEFFWWFDPTADIFDRIRLESEYGFSDYTITGMNISYGEGLQCKINGVINSVLADTPTATEAEG